MSGQLTTSGVISWDAVLSRNVNFVIAVLARLDKAGISPFTIEVGRALCCSFPLGSSAQLRITHAISVLSRYRSYSKTMWFGFGIKQVVTDLAESEEGMALVALCAALGNTYQPFFSAQVLREFCKMSGAPGHITPALRQWEMLVKLCAGILSTGEFVDKVSGFNRLVFGQSVEDRSPRCEPTTYEDLAKAIAAIAEIAQGNKANASFVGGLDCAWLAALAEWVLCLDVSVVGSSGTVLYRSRLKVRELAQVTILIPESPSKSLLKSQTTIVPSGEWLGWQTFDVVEEGSRCSLHRRSSRSNILRDTFGSSIDKLLEPETAQSFALYLESFSMLQTLDPRHFEEFRPSGDAARPSSMGTPLILDRNFFKYPIEPLFWAQESGKLRQFRRFASQYLPELTNCLQAAKPTVSQNDAETLALRALESIDATWPYSLDTLDCHNRMKTVVQVITTFLWIMFVSDVEDDVCPSVDGLANVFAWYLCYLRMSKSSRSTRIGDFNWLDLVFYCFSGLSDVDYAGREKSTTNGMVARAGGGICVYYRALENPDVPPGSIVKLHVVRGCITHEGSRFDSIRDTPFNFQGEEVDLPSETLPNISTDLTLDMMIHQLTSAAQLAISFHVRYLDVDGKSRSVWLRLGDLYLVMQKTLRPRRCRGNCDPLYALETFPNALCSWRNSSKDSPIINKEVIVEIQKAVERIRHTSTVWMLTTEKRQLGPCSTTTIIGRPLFLYILMSQVESVTTLSLSPFVKCLSCIVELGSWTEFRGSQWEDHYGGITELIVPDGSKLEITWEESAQGKQRREEREKEEGEEESSESAAQESSENADQESSENADQEYSENADQEPSESADKEPPENAEQEPFKGADKWSSGNADPRPSEKADQESSGAPKNAGQEPSEDSAQQSHESADLHSHESVDPGAS